MNPFQVRIRPMVSVCRVRVDGIRNAQWLLKRLSESFVFKTSEPLDEDIAAACSSFRCNTLRKCPASSSRSYLLRFLRWT